MTNVLSALRFHWNVVVICNPGSIVHAQTPGCRGEGTSSAITAIEDCLDARGVEATSIRVDGEPYRSVASLRSLF